MDVALAHNSQPSRVALVLRIAFDTLLPLLCAGILVAVLTDSVVNRIDAQELRLNTLLMGTRPFRVQTDFQSFVTALASSGLLLFSALGAAILVGIPAGVLYASTRNAPLRAAAWAIATLVAALPAFFWAVAAELALLFVYFRTGARPLPQAGFGVDEHLILPAFALGMRPAAYIFRLTASAVEEIRTRDYVRTAMAKGLPTRYVLWHHVIPNAMPTVIAAIILAARSALSSLPVIEFVYVWGGAGLTFIQAIGARQAALAGGLAFSFAVASAGLAFASDLVARRVATAVE
jgi:peptide/nickel transport system permease protein